MYSSGSEVHTLRWGAANRRRDRRFLGRSVGARCPRVGWRRFAHARLSNDGHGRSQTSGRSPLRAICFRFAACDRSRLDELVKRAQHSKRALEGIMLLPGPCPTRMHEPAPAKVGGGWLDQLELRTVKVSREPRMTMEDLEVFLKEYPTRQPMWHDPDPQDPS